MAFNSPYQTCLRKMWNATTGRGLIDIILSKAHASTSSSHLRVQHTPLSSQLAAGREHTIAPSSLSRRFISHLLVASPPTLLSSGVSPLDLFSPPPPSSPGLVEVEFPFFHLSLVNDMPQEAPSRSASLVSAVGGYGEAALYSPDLIGLALFGLEVIQIQQDVLDSGFDHSATTRSSDGSSMHVPDPLQDFAASIFPSFHLASPDDTDLEPELTPQYDSLFNPFLEEDEQSLVFDQQEAFDNEGYSADDEFSATDSSSSSSSQTSPPLPVPQELLERTFSNMSSSLSPGPVQQAAIEGPNISFDLGDCVAPSPPRLTAPTKTIPATGLDDFVSPKLETTRRRPTPYPASPLTPENDAISAVQGPSLDNDYPLAGSEPEARPERTIVDDLLEEGFPEYHLVLPKLSPLPTLPIPFSSTRFAPFDDEEALLPTVGRIRASVGYEMALLGRATFANYLKYCTSSEVRHPRPKRHPHFYRRIFIE